ncbi:hypothetical protein D3C79_1030230 [compost metagenome]
MPVLGIADDDRGAEDRHRDVGAAHQFFGLALGDFIRRLRHHARVVVARVGEGCTDVVQRRARLLDEADNVFRALVVH